MTNVQWVKYGTYAGCKINGTIKVARPATQRHMDRAYYLTALIEAPFYGAVQSYDGAAMSGGPLHNIAVYPKGLTQGSMFQLLRAIEVAQTKSIALLDLWGKYREQGWGITVDGVLRYTHNKKPVSGKEIRNTFTPLEGRVPKDGAQWETAKRWALAHQAVFADPTTFVAQKDFAIDWLLKTQRSVENMFYNGRDPKTLLADSAGFSIEEDLAMCAYHCYSVNGPGPARTDLLGALAVAHKGSAFARALLNQLATTSFGNWTVRYIRTRNAALNSGLWPLALFQGSNAIFPAR